MSLDLVKYSIRCRQCEASKCLKITYCVEINPIQEVKVVEKHNRTRNQKKQN